MTSTAPATSATPTRDPRLDTIAYRAAYRAVLLRASRHPRPGGTVRLGVSAECQLALQTYESHTDAEAAYRVTGAKVALAELAAGEHVMSPSVEQEDYARILADRRVP